MTPPGGCRPPDPLLLFNCFSVFDVLCLNLGLFPSSPQKLSLPPSDRARRCDLESPNESSVAQI